MIDAFIRYDPDVVTKEMRTALCECIPKSLERSLKPLERHTSWKFVEVRFVPDGEDDWGCLSLRVHLVMNWTLRRFFARGKIVEDIECNIRRQPALAPILSEWHRHYFRITLDLPIRYSRQY